jgi:DUF1365 family protein
MLSSAIYRGTVVHDRRRPKRHRLRYAVFYLLLDLDELAALDRRYRLFGFNRRAPLAFYDRDHGPADGTALRPWVDARLRDAGLEPDGGAVKLLCLPRMLGYVFNPLSIYFCYRDDGGLQAILYEVCNTHGERHTYVIPAPQRDRPVVRQSCAKTLYVSPFIDMDATYQFRVVPPGDTVRVTIREEDREGPILAASFSGTRTELDGLSLARCIAAFPFLTFKVIVAIHWEALQLLLRGFRVFRHTPAAAPVQSSIGTAETH